MDFREIGGAQMYFYDLSKAMIRRGYECTIISNIEGPMAYEAEKAGIKILPYKDLCHISQFDYDIINASHYPVINDIASMDNLAGMPLIQTCHSEIIPVEIPNLHHRIKKYIAIRETIFELLRDNGIKRDRIELIFNPIDELKFTTEGSSDKGYLLFVGSVDYLRINVVRHCITMAKEMNSEFLIVGRNDYPELVNEYSRIKIIPPTLEVAPYFRGCSLAIGIQKGRTGAEALMCGKPYLDFSVDNSGKILEEKMFYPDKDDQYVSKYRSSFVAESIEKLYESLLKERVNI